MKTFSQKEIRKYEKKARFAEQRFGETKDDEYLRKRDKYNDMVEELKRNEAINKKNKDMTICCFKTNSMKLHGS